MKMRNNTAGEFEDQTVGALHEDFVVERCDGGGGGRQKGAV